MERERGKECLEWKGQISLIETVKQGTYFRLRWPEFDVSDATHKASKSHSRDFQLEIRDEF